MQLTPLPTHWAPRKKIKKGYNLFRTRCIVGERSRAFWWPKFSATSARRWTIEAKISGISTARTKSALEFLGTFSTWDLTSQPSSKRYSELSTCFRICDLWKANLGAQNLLGVKGANRQVLYYIFWFRHHVDSVNVCIVRANTVYSLVIYHMFRPFLSIFM